ncbi:MAG: UDP-glucose/GDP-mannose dehydrogenase family protein [Verrucomicrobiaceae bacterium]|nr:UDP-glucose/GDP-mannose dehydrogenase family protein [Verrucomicrobiaceae bacterium]
MNVSIFGLGYVGAVTAGCLTERGHRVIGADVQQTKVDAFNAGVSPIVEPELNELLASAKTKGLLSATTDAAEAVRASEVSIVCVGTPSLASGRLNLDYVRKVSEQISAAIVAKGSRHVLIFRSTMLPGSTRSMVTDFFASTPNVSIYYCPEFLREGTAVKDFREPSLCVVGTNDGNAPATNEALELLGEKAEVLAWEGAELIKYSCNYFHALKVGFANEIGRMAKFVGVDGARVMDVVCRDEKLNISRYYMKPGNPFGGSCLPKDVSALSSLARMEGVNLPLLDNVLDSNEAHLDLLIKLITSKGVRRVGLLGLAFKKDTDDLRGSPMVAVAETLLGRGYELSIYDPSLNLSRLIGRNEAEINRRMPHLASLLRDSAEEVVGESELIIASQKCVSVDALRSVVKAEQCVIDVNGWRELSALAWGYEGLCW